MSKEDELQLEDYRYAPRYNAYLILAMWSRLPPNKIDEIMHKSLNEPDFNPPLVEKAMWISHGLREGTLKTLIPSGVWIDLAEIPHDNLIEWAQEKKPPDYKLLVDTLVELQRTGSMSLEYQQELVHHKERTSYKNIIGALLYVAFKDIQKDWKVSEKIKEKILDAFPKGIPGLSKRVLDEKLSQSLSSFKKAYHSAKKQNSELK